MIDCTKSCVAFTAVKAVRGPYETPKRPSETSKRPFETSKRASNPAGAVGDLSEERDLLEVLAGLSGSSRV